MTASFYTKDLNDCWGAGGVKVPGTWADNTDTMNSGTMLGRRERRTRGTGPSRLQNQGEPAGKAIYLTPWSARVKLHKSSRTGQMAEQQTTSPPPLPRAIATLLCQEAAKPFSLKEWPLGRAAGCPCHSQSTMETDQRSPPASPGLTLA